MPDNTNVYATANYTVATDDVSGVAFQRVKLDIGGDGVSSPVIAGNGLPVSDADVKAELQKLNSLVPARYDNFTCSYTGTNLTSVVFKLGAATVATVTLTYDVNNNLLTGATA
jgi:hypothetical protein